MEFEKRAMTQEEDKYSLREEGDILHNRSALAKYCYSHPQSKMSTEQDYYGVRVDTAL